MRGAVPRGGLANMEGGHASMDPDEKTGWETPKTKGDLKWLLGYSKRQRDDVVKNIYEKDYTFRRMLLEAVVHRRRESNEYWGDQVLPKPDLPP
ncbi:Hypp3050 [Branchiostoma lanceolatum]|uniref:Hypp1141 protein n=1 Tax=Branchiostoma lanceolatum TaxID=7740 RepID=A0A8J9YZ33_BRALA|nr:Hypp7111 [Branchiostoma lanceolatum]CAH1244465.1 Hypp7319 [Branchiostoma lanceolatum]CAH1253318.1 Hypp1141 [Branchiostoma lanceolatum]CAH1264722.1 Hypp3050 [Branchiostoma lanceolatum]